MISGKFQMVSMVITKLVPYISEIKYTPSNYVGPIYPIQLSKYFYMWQLGIFRYWGENAFGMGYNGGKLKLDFLLISSNKWIQL